jgi:pimeloyl-ACP methyl ester carboxylesterase
MSVGSRGLNIRYRLEGAGVPLVLLHGWSSMADAWWEAGYGDALVDEYRVIAIDRLGHGESDKPHDPALYLEKAIVSDIVAVLAAESVDRALVWGFSMGAVDAASLAVIQPERVAAVVCGGDTPIPSRHGEGRRQQHLAIADAASSADGLAALLRSLGSPEEAIAESLARNDPAALSAAMIGGADRFPAIANIQAPTLWYEGSDDHAFTPEDLQLAAQFDVETHLISGADHVATFRRAGDALRIVRPFLDRHRSRA